MSNANGKPRAGIGHYLRDLVFGASDGIVTTLAIVSGVMGAALPKRVGIIMGLANLIADGISMGASNYLGLKSELEQTGASVSEERPVRHGAATLIAFVVAGALPLSAFLFPSELQFPAAALVSISALAAIGAARTAFIPRPAWKCALEMVAVGALACFAAFTVGWMFSS